MIDEYGLEPGDALWRWKGAVQHWGIYWSPSQVLDIVPGSMPRLVTLQQFANGAKVYVQRPNDADRPAILARAWLLWENPSRYHLLRYNCEHLKNFVIHGRAYSDGIGLLTAIALFSGLALLTRRAG